MGESVLGTRVITQVAIIVKDINMTASKFAAFLGLEKPQIIITDEYDKAQTEYRGKPSKARAKLAFIKISENVDLELIEPDSGPSTWREFLDKNGEGVHHLAFVVKGIKDVVKKLGEIGMPLVQKGEYTGGRYAYIDATEDLKVMLELLEND